MLSGFLCFFLDMCLISFRLHDFEFLSIPIYFDPVNSAGIDNVKKA